MLEDLGGRNLALKSGSTLAQDIGSTSRVCWSYGGSPPLEAIYHVYAENAFGTPNGNRSVMAVQTRDWAKQFILQLGIIPSEIRYLT